MNELTIIIGLIAYLLGNMTPRINCIEHTSPTDRENVLSRRNKALKRTISDMEEEYDLIMEKMELLQVQYDYAMHEVYTLHNASDVSE